MAIRVKRTDKLLFTEGITAHFIDTRTIRGLGLISRHSLGIYGFHALIIHALRTRGIELKNWPILDIIWIFCATLAASLLLSMLVQRIDRNRLVS